MQLQSRQAGGSLLEAGPKSKMKSGSRCGEPERPTKRGLPSRMVLQKLGAHWQLQSQNQGLQVEQQQFQALKGRASPQVSATSHRRLQLLADGGDSAQDLVE